MNVDRVANPLASDELRALRAALLDALVAGAPRRRIDELVEQVNRMTERALEVLDKGT